MNILPSVQTGLNREMPQGAVGAMLQNTIREQKRHGFQRRGCDGIATREVALRKACRNDGRKDDDDNFNEFQKHATPMQE